MVWWGVSSEGQIDLRLPAQRSGEAKLRGACVWIEYEDIVTLHLHPYHLDLGDALSQPGAERQRRRVCIRGRIRGSSSRPHPIQDPQLYATLQDVVMAPGPQEPSDSGNPSWSRMLCRIVDTGFREGTEGVARLPLAPFRTCPHVHTGHQRRHDRGDDPHGGHDGQLVVRRELVQPRVLVAAMSAGANATAPPAPAPALTTGSSFFVDASGGRTLAGRRFN